VEGVLASEEVLRETIVGVMRDYLEPPLDPLWRGQLEPALAEVVVDALRLRKAIRFEAGRRKDLSGDLARALSADLRGFLLVEKVRAGADKALRCAPEARARLNDLLVERAVRWLREGPGRLTVLVEDLALLEVIRPLVRHHVDLALVWRGATVEAGSKAPPPAGRGPLGGLPAEVRAWEVRRSETPPEPDPDPERRERPGPEGIRKRRN
jgi:hypothetical protein